MKLLILFHFSITISAAQQAKIDSLRQVLSATKEDTIKKPILESLGHLYREERKLDSSIQSYQLALVIVQNKKNGYPAVQEEYTLGILDFLTNATGNYSMSMTYATRALKLSEKLQYDKGRAFALACIATNYSGMGDLKRALVYFFRSKEAFELYESGHWAIQNIAETYLKMHQLDSALYFNRIAYHIADTGHHQEYMKAFALRIFAYIYAEKNDDTTAMKYYRSFVNDFNTYNLNNREIGHTFLGMARLFLKNRRLDSAIYYSKKSLESARIYNDQQYIFNSSEILYSLYDSLQNQKEAFKYYKIAAAAKDSMASLEKVRNIQNLSFNEQVREKEKREVEAKERARTRLAISISAIVLFIISFLIWNRIRQLRLRHRMILGQKEAEKLKAIDKMKDKFFSNITHELRTPLSLILSPVEFYLQHPEQLKNAPQLLQTVYKNSNYLLSLINQLLDISKLDAGKMQVFLSKGRFGAYIGELAIALEEESAKRQITLHFEINVSEEYLFDSEHWKKIVNNLLSNALKFTPGNGHVYVLVKKIGDGEKGDTIQLIVKDTGIGIKNEQLPFITDRFYQADNTTTRKYEGAGIGLALVHELVKLMGGRLEIESEENKGSTFTITVTLLQPDKQSVYPELVPVAAGIKNLKVDTYQKPDPAILQKTDSLILIVEDNTELRKFLYDSIEPAYKVITASNGEEGYQLAITQKPDLIISDVMMPVMDGFEFCNKIKNNPETSYIAFIILSAKTTSESKTTGLKRGADDYLTKPFSVDELLARIQNLLQRQVRRKEMQKQIFELEAKALRAQMNPHFIFNCMNSIKALIQNDDKARSVEYLTTFAKLIRTLLENSDKRQISLHDEIETCQLYTKLEMMRLKGKLDCRFNIDPNVDLKYLMVPALIIQPFIENAIWHGIVPKEEGTIQINVKGENNTITCEIDDDGIGRELSQLNKPVSTAMHESRGVHISQTRLNLQKMLNETGATIEIRDKYNGNKPTGTRVVIAFHQN